VYYRNPGSCQRICQRLCSVRRLHFPKSAFSNFQGRLHPAGGRVFRPVRCVVTPSTTSRRAGSVSSSTSCRPRRAPSGKRYSMPPRFGTLASVSLVRLSWTELLQRNVYLLHFGSSTRSLVRSAMRRESAQCTHYSGRQKLPSFFARQKFPCEVVGS